MRWLAHGRCFVLFTCTESHPRISCCTLPNTKLLHQPKCLDGYLLWLCWTTWQKLDSLVLSRSCGHGGFNSSIFLRINIKRQKACDGRIVPIHLWRSRCSPHHTSRIEVTIVKANHYWLYFEPCLFNRIVCLKWSRLRIHYYYLSTTSKQSRTLQLRLYMAEIQSKNE